MNSTTKRKLRLNFHVEPAGWLSLRQPAPELRSLSGEQLLLQAQKSLVSPLRYARADREIELIGEYPLFPTGDVHEQAQSRLTDWVHWRVGPITPDDDTIEATLGETVQGWTRRDEGWVIPPFARLPIEIVVEAVTGGVHLAATLSTIDEGDTRMREALCEFLCRAQLALRFARVELEGGTVRVVSRVETSSFDCLFDHALQSVAAACHALAAEVRAFSSIELTEAYLGHVRATASAIED